jgi:quercetin dioxygenase-like cupin family protein
MMTLKPVNFGNLMGKMYDFPEVNDVLPMHTHGEADNHISVVSKGSFKAHGDGWEMIITAGNVVDWPANQAHEFIALEPNSRLVNITKS